MFSEPLKKTSRRRQGLVSSHEGKSTTRDPHASKYHIVTKVGGILAVGDRQCLNGISEIHFIRSADFTPYIAPFLSPALVSPLDVSEKH